MLAGTGVSPTYKFLLSILHADAQLRQWTLHAPRPNKLIDTGHPVDPMR